MLVTVRKGDVNGAMRVLKKKLMREGFFQELRRKNPSCQRVRRNAKQKLAGRRRWQRKQAKLKAERGY